jgi:hypothetical protein
MVLPGLTTDLSRISGSFVIGRHTAQRQAAPGKMQLVDAEAADTFGPSASTNPSPICYMQDEIVSRLANTLNTQLVEAEAQRAERSPHPDAMDLYFQRPPFVEQGAYVRILGTSSPHF